MFFWCIWLCLGSSQKQNRGDWLVPNGKFNPTLYISHQPLHPGKLTFNPKKCNFQVQKLIFQTPFCSKMLTKNTISLGSPCFWEVPMILSRACFPGPAKELQTSLPHLPAPTNYASIPSQRSSADIGCPCGITPLRHQPSSATQLQCFRVPGSRCPFRFWVWQANDAPLPDPEMETQQVLLLKIKQLVSNSTLSITQWLFGGFCYNPSISTPSFSEIPGWYVKWLQPGYQLPIRHCLGAIGQFRQFLVLASWELKEPWAESSMPTTLTKKHLKKGKSQVSRLAQRVKTRNPQMLVFNVLSDTKWLNMTGPQTAWGFESDRPQEIECRAKTSPAICVFHMALHHRNHDVSWPFQGI